MPILVRVDVAPADPGDEAPTGEGEGAGTPPAEPSPSPSPMLLAARSVFASLADFYDIVALSDPANASTFAALARAHRDALGN